MKGPYKTECVFDQNIEYILKSRQWNNKLNITALNRMVAEYSQVSDYN